MQGEVGVSGYTRKSKTGKTVHVRKYSQTRKLVAGGVGRVAVAAQPGQMPNNRTLPTTPKNDAIFKTQLKSQSKSLGTLRQQVAAARAAAAPEVRDTVPDTRKAMKQTVLAKRRQSEKKSAAEKKTKDAEKTVKERGAAPDRLKEATDHLAKIAEVEKNRKAAGEKAKTTKAKNEKIAAKEEKAAAARAVTPEDYTALMAPLDGGDNKAATESFKKIFEGEFNGFKVSIDGDATTYITKRGSSMKADFAITKGGKRVGKATRTFDANGTVHHSILNVEKEHRGQGFATAFNKAAEEQYRAMGIRAITLDTDEVGGYAWARAGYDWNLDEYDDNADFSNRLDSHLNAILAAAEQQYEDSDPAMVAIREQINELLDRSMNFADSPGATLDDDMPTPFDLTQIGYTPGATNWPGKDGMIDANWSGVKRL